MTLEGGRRFEERTAVNREFEVLGPSVSEHVTNLSRSGAFLRTSRVLPVGTVVKLRFAVLADELEHLECDAEVVRVQNDPPGLGVVFTQLDEQTLRTLEDVLAHHGGRQ